MTPRPGKPSWADRGDPRGRVCVPRSGATWGKILTATAARIGSADAVLDGSRRDATFDTFGAP